MRLRDWDRNLKIRLAGEMTFNVIFWAFFPFLALSFSEAFGKGWAGLLLMLSQALSVFANLVGGYCADRFGRKKMMVLAALGQAAGYGLFALASSPLLPSPVAGFAGFSLASLCGALYWPASQAMVADVVEEKHRSEVFAIFYTGANMAVVIGPLLGSAFYLDRPYLILAIASGFCLLLTAVLGRSLRETLPGELAARKRSGGSYRSWYHAVAEQFKDYRTIGADRVFMLFLIAGVLLSQTFMQLDLLFPVFLKDTVESTTAISWGDWSFRLTGEKLFGFVVSENGLLVAIFTVAVTKWMTTFRDRYVFVGGALCYGAGIFLFGQMSSFWGFALAIVVLTLAELMTAGPQQAFVARLAPDHMRGQYFAAASLRFTLGRTIAPMSIPLSQWIGFPWTFATLTLLAVLSAGLYGVMFDRHERGSATSA